MSESGYDVNPPAGAIVTACPVCRSTLAVAETFTIDEHDLAELVAAGADPAVVEGALGVSTWRMIVCPLDLRHYPPTFVRADG